jgi:hypothetical protein
MMVTALYTGFVNLASSELLENVNFILLVLIIVPQVPLHVPETGIALPKQHILCSGIFLKLKYEVRHSKMNKKFYPFEIATCLWQENMAMAIFLS